MIELSQLQSCCKEERSNTYVELINKLGQYELLSLCTAWGRQYVGDCPVDWSLLLVLHALQVAVKPDITR